MTCNPFVETPVNLLSVDIEDSIQESIRFSSSVVERFDMEVVKKTTLLISNLIEHPNTDMSEYPNLKEKLKFMDLTTYEVAEFLDSTFYSPEILNNILSPYDYASLTYNFPAGITNDQAILKAPVAIVQPSVGAKNMLNQLENFANSNVSGGVSAALCGAISNIFSKVGELKGLFGNIQGLVDKFGKFNIAAIVSSLLGKLNIAKEMLKKVVDKMVDKVKQIAENLTGAVKELAGKARNFFNKKLKDVKAFFSGDAVKTIKEKLEGFVDKLSEQFPTPKGESMDFILFRVCQMMTAVQGLLENPVNAIKAEMKKFESTIKQVKTMGNIFIDRAKVAGIVIPTLDVRKKTIEEAKKALNKAADQLTETGKVGQATEALGGALEKLNAGLPLESLAGNIDQALSSISTANIPSSIQKTLGNVAKMLDSPFNRSAIASELSGAISQLKSVDLSSASSTATSAASSAVSNIANGLTSSTAGVINGFSEAETVSFLNAMGQRESSNNYEAVNQYGFSGKYQFGAAALEDRGYIKPGTFKSGKSNDDILSDPNNWTGKDGITSRSAFLKNPDVQEKVMIEQVNANISQLKANGAWKPGDPKEDLMGMAAGAHLLGATGIKKWKDTGVGSDANGTTGGEYTKLGKQAYNNAGKSKAGSATNTANKEASERGANDSDLQPVAYSSLEISLEEWDWVTSLKSKDMTKDPDVHWTSDVANMGKISTKRSGGSGQYFNSDQNYYSEEDGTDAGIAEIVRVNPQLLVWVRRVAKKMGKTITIRSAFRSFYYNKVVLKEKTGTNSPHSKAQALDLSLGGMSSKQKALMIKYCSMEGFERISYYPAKNFIHVDIVPKRLPGGSWQSRDGGDKYIREAIQNHLHDRYRRG